MFEIFLSLLVGSAVGACGGYHASKFTDKRRKNEKDSDVRKIFIQSGGKMLPMFKSLQLILEDKNTELLRSIFVLPSRKVVFNFNGPYIPFYTNEIESLELKLNLLESNGFIVNITMGNTTEYKMTELFISLLLEAKITDTKISF